jgi:hypothetical protein
MRALWKKAAAATRDRSFGVHVAQAVPPGTIDVIEYLFATARDFADGLMRLAKYKRLIHDPSNTQLVFAHPLHTGLRGKPTLQHQLAEHGTMHSTLVDDIRRGLALKHIGDASISITEVGYMLHFSDATARSERE